MTVFRPDLSARIPANGLATSANKLVQDVIRLLSSVVSGRPDKSDPIDTRVADMTPVLYPRQFLSVASYMDKDGGSLLVTEQQATDAGRKGQCPYEITPRA